MRIKVTIPESLTDIKAADYARFMLANPTEDNMDELALSYFVGISDSDRKKIAKVTIDDIKRQTLEALNTNSNLQRFLTIDGVEYGFHPDLETMTVGEYADLETYFVELYKNWDRVLGILYRPVVNKSMGRYEIETYNPDKHNGQVFKDVTADVLQSVTLFFYRLEITLAKDILMSMEREVKKGKHPYQLNKPLGNVGDGITSSIHLLEGIYSNLKK